MASKTNTTSASSEVPIFLRKTFHMIDTCDPTIACWSEDGETFVVKDPVQFEQTIIPQFFKHSKFSSFVRQLNFYSFRKIKYADTLRIDPKLEAETANYWRFRHENFRKGRPDLLSEIKRMNGQKATSADKKQPDEKSTEKGISSEVSALKKKIEEMNKSIDELTTMVQKVNLKQEEQERGVEGFVGGKRKKFSAPDIRPDDMLSSMEIEEFASLPLPDPSPLSDADVKPPAAVPSSEGSDVAGDVEFIDELFTAFGEEDALLNFEDLNEEHAPAAPNRPDPELMSRLGDALAALPKNVQQMIVERLIQAITSTDFIGKCSQQARKADGVASPTVVAPAEDSEEAAPQTHDLPPMGAPPFPLAAATLAALLHHYSTQIQGKEVKNLSSKAALPIIPAHA